MPVLLFGVAILLVVIYFGFVPHGEPRSTSEVVQRPSQQLGRLDGKSWFERKTDVSVAQHEKELHEAEAASVAFIHARNMIDKADAMGVPREVMNGIIASDHAHAQRIDLLEQSARVEVQKEGQMIQVWLEAARSAQMAPYFNLRQVRYYLEEAYKERHRLEQLASRNRAEDDMLRLLNDAIPVMEGDHRARVRQIALSSGDGTIHRGLSESSEGPGDSEQVSEGSSEPVPAAKRRAGF